MKSPLEVSTGVDKLLKKINSIYSHEIISLRPCPEATIRNCYGNVQRHVEEHGGQIIYGWLIWEGDFIAEGEHHAVWETCEGDLIDITPQNDKIECVMFVPDDRNIYSGLSFDNLRVNITNNPLVDHYILLHEALFEAEQYGSRLNDAQVSYPRIALEYQTYIRQWSEAVYAFLLQGGKMGKICFCNSMKSYSKCCGRDFNRNVQDWITKLHYEMSLI